jgi:hypothetical protein
MSHQQVAVLVLRQCSIPASAMHFRSLICRCAKCDTDSCPAWHGVQAKNEVVYEVLEWIAYCQPLQDIIIEQVLEAQLKDDGVYIKEIQSRLLKLQYQASLSRMLVLRSCIWLAHASRMCQSMKCDVMCCKCKSKQLPRHGLASEDAKQRASLPCMQHVKVSMFDASCRLRHSC